MDRSVAIAQAKRIATIDKNVIRAAARTTEIASNTPFSALPKITATETTLFETLRRLATARPLRRGMTSIYISDARTGAVVYALHEDAPLNPASNVKLIATATALDTLGPDWRYSTRLFGPMLSADGVVDGDLYLRGNFDPTLYENHLDELATKLFALGLRRVDGDILTGDIERDAVARAKVQIKVTGGEIGQPPTIVIDRASGLFDVVNEAKTIKNTKRRRPALRLHGGSVVDDNGHPRFRIHVTGAVRTNRTRTYWRVIKNRPLYTAYALAAALERAGIEVRGIGRQQRFQDYVRLAGPSFLPVELARHDSASLGAIVNRINKKSINRWADHVIMTAGAAAYGGAPTMDKGVRLMSRWLSENAGIAPGAVSLDTGSGLSYRTKLSTRQIVRVLREATGLRHDALPVALHSADALRVTDIASDVEDAPSLTDPGLKIQKIYRNSLSVAGFDGTLRRRFRKSPVRGHLVGKTGTLTRIIAISGVLTLDRDMSKMTSGGPALTFSIVTNGHAAGMRYDVRQQHLAIVEAMYRYLRARNTNSLAHMTPRN